MILFDKNRQRRTATALRVAARTATCLWLLTSACGSVSWSNSDAGAATTPEPMWVSALGTFYLDGVDFRVLCFDDRGRVAGLPKNGASSMLWAEGHRVDTSTLTQDPITLVSYLDAHDRMAGFLGSSANAAVFARDGRGLKTWYSPPPGGALFPLAWSDDDRLFAQGHQSGGFDSGFTALIQWQYDASKSLPESARIGQLYTSERIIWANSRFDYVTHDIALNDVIPNKLVVNGGTVATEKFTPLAVLDDGAAWGTLAGSDAPHAARLSGGQLTSVADPSSLLAVSHGGSALYSTNGLTILRTPDGTKHSLAVPVVPGAKYWLNDQGRVLLQVTEGNTWLYTPRTMPNPVGTTELSVSQVQVAGLEPAAFEVTNATASSTAQGFFLELQSAPANVTPRTLRVQAQLGRAPAQGDTWQVGAWPVNGHIEQVLLGWSEGTQARVFFATSGTVRVVELAGNSAKLTLDSVVFIESGDTAFSLSGTIEVHSVNDP